MIRLWTTRKSTGIGTHESTIIEPLQRRYMQIDRPARLPPLAACLRRPPIDRPAAALCSGARRPAACG
jgi:hypothetical protein